MTDQQHALRARQLNHHDELYWKSRGWESRPPDWQERYARGDVHPPGRNDDMLNLLNPPIIPEHMVMPVANPALTNNPDHLAYWQARGWDEMPARTEKNNPNNDAYWVLRGYEERPPNWRNKV